MRRLALLALLLLVVPVTSASAGQYRAFRSPSGAITCAILDSEDLHTASCYSAYTLRLGPPRNKCGSKGLAVTVHRRGRATLGAVCNPYGFHLRPLRYGRSIKVGPMQCTSRRTGMTCHSRVSGHGFTIRRKGLRRF